jgi:hypothetical protein
MGSRPSANIFFGFRLNSSDDSPEDSFDFCGGEDWEDEYARRKGLKDLSENHSQADWEKRYEDKKKIIDGSGVEVFTEGAPGDGFYTAYVGIKDGAISGDWDEPTKVDPKKFVIKPDWETKLRAFCEVMGIEYEEPEFLMICAYG